MTFAGLWDVADFDRAIISASYVETHPLSSCFLVGTRFSLLSS